MRPRHDFFDRLRLHSYRDDKPLEAQKKSSRRGGMVCVVVSIRSPEKRRRTYGVPPF